MQSQTNGGVQRVERWIREQAKYALPKWYREAWIVALGEEVTDPDDCRNRGQGRRGRPALAGRFDLRRG